MITETKNVCLQAIFSNLQKAISNVVILHIGMFSQFKIGLDSKFKAHARLALDIAHFHR